MTLYLEQNEYISLHGQEAGVIVTINPPDVTPLADEEGITIRPGTVASIGIRFVSLLPYFYVLKAMDLQYVCSVFFHSKISSY